MLWKLELLSVENFTMSINPHGKCDCVIKNKRRKWFHYFTYIYFPVRRLFNHEKQKFIVNKKKIHEYKMAHPSSGWLDSM